MYTKTLLIALSVAAFSSCSTAYKSGQTPDDVYYSPVRVEEEDNDKDKDDNRNQTTYQSPEDWQVRMAIRDRRWRDLDDYSYNNSPYNYCYCQCNHYTGYYYNPYFYPTPIYKINTVKLNNTPRMVNLNAYHNYNPVVANQKTSGTAWINPSRYNNSNTNNNKGLGNTIRRMVEPKRNSTSTSSSSNNERSYTPTSNNNSNSSSNSSNSSSSSSNTGSVSRPARGN